MTRDFSKLKLFWQDRLQRLPADFLSSFDLDANTFYFLTNVGLPNDSRSLNQAIEINFYFDRDRITKRTFDGISYLILGDDSGAQFAISLRDNQLYAVDFDNVIDAARVCFVNSTIDKFIETIQLFIEFQNKMKDGVARENDLIESMKSRMKEIDEKSIENENTWWGSIINDPIRD